MKMWSEIEKWVERDSWSADPEDASFTVWIEQGARIEQGAWIGCLIHKYCLNLAGGDLLRIGCEIQPIPTWRAEGRKIARRQAELKWYCDVAEPLLDYFEAQAKRLPGVKK